MYEDLARVKASKIIFSREMILFKKTSFVELNYRISTNFFKYATASLNKKNPVNCDWQGQNKKQTLWTNTIFFKRKWPPIKSGALIETYKKHSTLLIQ